MKTTSIILIIIILIGSVLFIPMIDTDENINQDLQQAAVDYSRMTVVSRYYSLSFCGDNGKVFKDYSTPRLMPGGCSQDSDCQLTYDKDGSEINPLQDGVSNKAAERGICCLDITSPSFGHCGEYRN